MKPRELAEKADMSRDDRLLFSGHDLRDALEQNLQRAIHYVEDIQEDQFRHSSDDEIIQHVFSKYELTPLELDENNKEMESCETKVDIRSEPNRAILDYSQPTLVPGVRFLILIPFVGDIGLWDYRTGATGTLPRGNITTRYTNSPGYLEISVEHPSDTLKDETQIEEKINKIVELIQRNLKVMHTQVTKHNGQLMRQICDCVLNRRTRLQQHDKVAKSLNIPLRTNPNAPDLSSLPIKRKLVKPLPPAPSHPNEPGIPEEDYDHILKVIRHAGRTFEAVPNTMKKLEEEDIRNLILSNLNGHYEGLANGEAFRCTGKTDIKIESENRAAFVAECKNWGGEKVLFDALDQLLGYLTWRDCKTALIVFNKEAAGFSKIQLTLAQSLERHDNFVSSISIPETGEWRIRMRSKNDPDRYIVVHVFLFNLYVSKI